MTSLVTGLEVVFDHFYAILMILCHFDGFCPGGPKNRPPFLENTQKSGLKCLFFRALFPKSHFPRGYPGKFHIFSHFFGFWPFWRSKRSHFHRKPLKMMKNVEKSLIFDENVIKIAQNDCFEGPSALTSLEVINPSQVTSVWMDFDPFWMDFPVQVTENWSFFIKSAKNVMLFFTISKA